MQLTRPQEILTRIIRKKGSFYRPAKWVGYDLLPCVQRQQEICVQELQILLERDRGFRRRLESDSDNSVYEAFVLQCYNYKNQEYNDNFVWTEERQEIRSALLQRADFELLQMNLFLRNMRWINKEQRKLLLDEIRAGIDAAHTYLFAFQKSSEVVKSKAQELKTCLNEKIELSMSETLVVSND